MKKQTLAEKYKNLFACGAIDIEEIAIQKNQDYKNEKTWWIFEDGSAIGICSHDIISIKKNYGLHRDHEKLTN
jgi:hypothetical protein